MTSARLLDLGMMEYQQAWEIQKQVAEEALAGGPDTLIFVEHPMTLTLGASFQEKNLLLSADEYAREGIQLVRTDRGGDVTFHGPAQLVQYPIFNLDRHGKDLHKWLRDLEETQLRALSAVGLEGSRFPPHTGAWVNGRKVAAIGVKIRKWVSLHGIALNCDNDLRPFSLIVPCGIQHFGVTSLSAELGRRCSVEEMKPVVAQAFSEVFGLRF